jgi:hypothetical protein
VSAEPSLPAEPPTACPATGRGDRPVSEVTATHSAADGARPPRVDAAGWPPDTTLSGRVAALDRLTLRLGVAVAAVIAGCSYAVSATSLYALGHQAGYSPWQAVAVPVVADGPAIYGMFRIVSRSRRRARGAGYGWLLVFAGTAASIAGNIAHAHPSLVARGIAAAIPLAVLAMLEGLKGDAEEVTRLAQPATCPADPESAGARPATIPITVRRADPRPVTDRPGANTAAVRELPARASMADASMASTRLPDASVRDRLKAAFARGRPDGRAWTARSLAQAAGCGRTTAATFLQAQRGVRGEGSA